MTIQRTSALGARFGTLVGIGSAAVPPLRSLIRLARRKPLGFVGLLVLVLIGGAAVFAPWITDIITPRRADLDSRVRRWSTGRHGQPCRDLFSRVVYGARVSFGISFAAVLLAKVIATVVAVVSGYYGGSVDTIVQRSSTCGSPCRG